MTRWSFHWQSTFPPWLRGKGDCLPHCTNHLTLILGGSSTGQVQLRFGENFNSSFVELDRPVNDPTKTQVKAGRGVQENTRQYREAKEANVICLAFLTDI